MKGVLALLIILASVAALAGCGGDNTTQFVLSSGSASSSASGSAASPSGSAGVSASAAASALPATAATPMPDGSKIIIDSPDASSLITSPVDVSGTASVDKGTVVAVVLDGSGKELGRATTTASAAKPDFGHFDVTVSFTAPTSSAKGQIKVFGVSPRDGTTPTNYYFISVRFG